MKSGGYSEWGFGEPLNLSFLSRARSRTTFDDDLAARIPGRGVRVDVKPEECRFYLHYSDSGRKHADVLKEAESLKTDIEKELAKLDETRLKIEVCSYDPSTSLGGLFKKEKARIRLQLRITVKLNKGGEKESWEDAKLVAGVLDLIDEIRRENKLGRKLTKGSVRYAVQSIGPAKKELLEKLEKDVGTLKDSHARMNGVKEAELFCDVHFGDIHAETQSLEKVTVMLPYAVRFELRDEKEK
jgi:hypothetical protein